jgi:pyruvate kinase
VTFRRLALFWGVTPVLVDTAATTDELIDHTEQVLLAQGLAKPGDNVVITMGVPVGSGVQTNTLKLHQMPPI